MDEILIYGGIGMDVQAREIVDQLNNADGPVTVRVDSYGGDVYAGISIMNALRRYPDVVTVYVDGMAASAASFIAVGGADRLIMSPNSSMLIHGAWTNGAGNAAEFTEIAANLAQITENIAGIYAEKAGNDKQFWLDVMQKDTTYSAEQAVEIGLADEVGASKKSVSAQQRQLVMASQHLARQESTAAAGVPEIVSRSSAPPPETVTCRSASAREQLTTSPLGEKGDKMTILNQLAQELKVKPEDVQRALSGFLNEVVPISGEVEVTYPADVKIVPTERITVDPTIGDKPAGEAGGEDPAVEVIPEGEDPQPDSAAVQLAKSAGLVFAMGDIAEGFEASVDEGGTVTIKAPSGVEPGDVADFTVLVNETPVALSVTVRSLSDDGEDAVEDPAVAPDMVEAAQARLTKAQAASNDVVMVPRAHFDYLNQVAANFGKAQAELDAKKRAERVDRDIKDGRFNPAHRAQALAVLERDPKAYGSTWGDLPKNTAVPVVALGNSGVEAVGKNLREAVSREELMKRANDRAKNGAKHV